MSDTKIRVRKATSLLRQDHQTVKRLFSEMEKLPPDDETAKTQLFGSLKMELDVHAQIEEEIFYPAIESVESEQAQDLVREAHEEHRIVKMLLEELAAMDLMDPQFDAKLKVLEENVLHHAEEEEKEIFPIFDDLDREHQDQVSDRLAGLRRALMDGE